MNFGYDKKEEVFRVGLQKLLKKELVPLVNKIEEEVITPKELIRK